MQREEVEQVQFVCPAGHWCTAGLAVECEAGFYNPFGGANNQTACLQCPAFSTTPTAASIAVSQCQCTPGYYDRTLGPANASAAPQCVPCPIGTVCASVGVTLHSLPLKPGYYRASATATNVFRCPDSDAGCGTANECLNSTSACRGGDDFTSICHAGLDGILCAACAHMNREQCLEVQVPAMEAVHCWGVGSCWSAVSTR